MSRARTARALCVGALLTSAATARALAPEDFARGLELTIVRPGVIQALTLPAEVLSALLDRSYGDVCVFDAQGKPLAQALAFPVERPELVTLPLPFFPLEARARDATGGVAVTVERNDEGAITRAFSEPLMADSTRVIGYLIDRGPEAREALEALTLGVDATDAFTVQVRVESSSDLDRFAPLAMATIARLEHEGRTLKRDLVELPPTSARYLRLSFRKPPAGLALREVIAQVRRPAALPARHVLALAGEPVADGDAQIFQFTMSGTYAPDRYRVLLPEGTTLIEATLESSEAPSGPYAALDRGIFRRDQSAVRELPRTHDAYFRIRVAPKGGGIRGGHPILQLGYLAPRMLFHDEGVAPYLLAYGSARARCTHFDEAELASITTEPIPRDDTVKGGRTRVLGGELVRTRDTGPGLRTYVLWSVLVSAVAVLGLLARRLVRSL